MATNRNMYYPYVSGAPPAPPVENNNNIVGENYQQQEPLFIGPHNLVGPRLPSIVDLVENDPEIIRIYEALEIIIGSDYYNVRIHNKIRSYVRNATDLDLDQNKREMFNFKKAINATVTSIERIQSIQNIQRNPSERYMLRTSIERNNVVNKNFIDVVTLGAGKIGKIFKDILEHINESRQLNRQYILDYSNLILQLYRRIQEILDVNWVQQGGKKNNRRTKKRSRVNNKQSKKQRSVNNKQSKNKK
jgi:hypothetical protein